MRLKEAIEHGDKMVSGWPAAGRDAQALRSLLSGARWALAAEGLVRVLATDGEAEEPLALRRESAKQPSPIVAPLGSAFRPDDSRRFSNGIHDLRYWSWRSTYPSRLLRLRLVGETEQPSVCGFSVGTDVPISNLPCRLDLFNALLMDGRVVVPPGMEVSLTLAEPAAQVGCTLEWLARRFG